MSGGDGRGVGQKSERATAPTPHTVSFTDFFPSEPNFDLFGDLAPPCGPRERPSKHRVTPGSIELRIAIARLAGAGLTRAEIARQVGIGESTLYANYFPEIGGQRGKPGRRRHQPDERTRAIVRALRMNGASHLRIAEAIGISEPTLRRAYSQELQPRRKDQP